MKQRMLIGPKSPLCSLSSTVSPLPALRPVLSPESLMVRPVSGSPSLEGLGMAILKSGDVKWHDVNLEVCVVSTGVRLYHTVNNIPGWGNLVYGGRSSPLHPIRSLLKVTCDLPDPTSHENMATVSLS